MEKKNVKVLICIDMQRDFVYGSLKNDAAKDIIPNLIGKLNNFDGEYIIFTRDTHSEDYLYSKEGEKLPVKHCVQGTSGWDLIPQITDFINQNLVTRKHTIMVIDKPTFGSVEKDRNGNSLISVVKTIVGDKDNVSIELVGTCTGICVVSNALLLKAFFYDKADITVDASCCACITEDTHNAALTTMECCQINVVNRKVK